MKSKYFFRIVSLLALCLSFLPVSYASASASIAPPPVDMFQLPWDLGKSWVAIDGIGRLDNPIVAGDGTVPRGTPAAGMLGDRG